MTALRVLHVDDEPDIREVVKLSLSLDPDLETRSCSCGPEALLVVKEWQPDVILLDVMMPTMDGPSTLGHLQDNQLTASIPVVFMTGRAEACEVEVFRALGAAGVISKPFNPMTLAASARAYVQSADVRLEKLGNNFLRRVNDDAAALTICRATFNSAGPLETVLKKVREIAHGLAGAGGIFGFSEISDAAAALEQAISLKGSVSTDEVTRAIDQLLGSLDASLIPSGALASSQPAYFRRSAR